MRAEHRELFARLWLFRAATSLKLLMKGMAGKLNHQRERALAEDFVRFLAEPKLRLLDEQNDKPDAAVEVIGTGERIGVEITELLPADVGRDRSLESLFCGGLVEACQELFGPAGDIDVSRWERPRDKQQVRDWLRAFRDKAKLCADRMLAFPPEPPVGGTVDQWTAWQHEMQPLLWAEVFITLYDPRENHRSEWFVFGRDDEDHLSKRHGADIDDLVVRTVEGKIAKAVDYAFQGPLWLLMRNTCRTLPSPGVDARLAQLPGVERFAAIWMLPLPLSVIELKLTPIPRCLLRSG